MKTILCICVVAIISLIGMVSYNPVSDKLLGILEILPDDSLAEYCSMLAIKFYYGEEAFKQIIAHHQQQAEDVPDSITLINYERYGPYDQAMAYSAGTLILHMLHEHIGEQAFYQLLADIDAQQIRTTQQFVSLIDEKFDEQWLKKIKEQIGN